MPHSGSQAWWDRGLGLSRRQAGRPASGDVCTVARERGQSGNNWCGTDAPDPGREGADNAALGVHARV